MDDADCLAAAVGHLRARAPELAEPLFAGLTGRTPSAMAWRGLAECRIARGALDDARADLEQALALDPDDVDAWIALGDVETWSHGLDGLAAVMARALRRPIPPPRSFHLAVRRAAVAWTERDVGTCRMLIGQLNAALGRIGTPVAQALQGFTMSLAGHLHRLMEAEAAGRGGRYSDAPLPPVFVLGDSHCIGPAQSVVAIDGHPHRVLPRYVIGCKAWHLGNNRENAYKEGARRQVAALPPASAVIASAGDIDCRFASGFYNLHRKTGAALGPAILGTVEGYLDFVTALAAPGGHALRILAPPAPAREPPGATADDRRLVAEIAARFHEALQAGCARRGLALVDYYALTVAGDGLADPALFVDLRHLQAGALAQALAAVPAPLPMIVADAGIPAPERLTLTEAAAAIAQGRLSAERLTAACLDRIGARDSAIRAWTVVDAERALAVARIADRLPVAARGPLHGLPIGIKDLIDTADLPTAYGSAAFEGHRPAADAGVVAALRRAGAILPGKTVTTEFAYRHPGPTANPRDPARTPGGSSSGSAAAVADGHVPAALGTQTCGSVIRPAAFCGIYGFKPTIGRTDLRGVHELAASFDTVGWMARTADDLMLLAAVLLAGFSAPRPVDRPRLALCLTPYAGAAQPESLEAVRAVARRLAPHAAVAEATLPPIFQPLHDVHHLILTAEASLAFQPVVEQHPDRVSPALAAMVATAARIPARDYIAAQRMAAAGRASYDALMRGLDALIVPAAPGEAPLGLGDTGNAVFNGFWSLIGCPAVTLPAVSGPAGLPIGVQLVGRRGGDETLLALAAWAAARLGLGTAPIGLMQM